MALNNLTDLLKDQLQDLYSAENQLVKALPKLADSARSGHLKSAIQSHLAETRQQVQRLERIAKELDFKPGGKTCAAMKGLVDEGGEAIGDNAQGVIHDVNLMAAAQRVEHYEISAYGTAREFAEVLGYTDVADLLQETLNEERAADHTLTEICRELFEKAPMTDSDTEHAPKKVKEDENRDPISGAHGAHPVGAGVGAATGGIAGGAAAGAAIGTTVGPVGTLVGAAAGAAAGAVAGGLAGKAAAEALNPTVEHDYWRSQFRTRRYILPDDQYEIFAPAYQYGWESRPKYKGRQFADVEQELEKGWRKARGSSSLAWDRAKHAVRDSWERLSGK
jgi:ferritin-like metal-binding protein YciE